MKQSYILLIAAFAVTLTANGQGKALREATTAEMSAGTIGLPAVVTPRRAKLISGGGVTTNLAQTFISYATNDLVANGCFANLITGGAFFSMYQPNGVDLLGNSYSNNFADYSPIDGARFYQTNWVTMTLPQPVTNFTLCLSLYMPVNWYFGYNSTYDSRLNLQNAACLSNSTNSSSFVYEPMSYALHKVWMSNGTNYGVWMTNNINNTKNAFSAPMSCKFVNFGANGGDDIEFTWHYLAFSHYNGRVSIYFDGKLCAANGSAITNALFPDQVAGLMNTLNLGGGLTNWKKHLDDWPNGNPPGNNTYYDRGTNFYGNIGAWALFNKSIDENAGIQKGYYQFLTDLDPRTRFLDLQGSSILSILGSYYTNSIPVLIQQQNPEILLINETCQGGGGIGSIYNITGGWTNGMTYPTNSALWLNRNKFTFGSLSNDQQRNGANAANYLSFYTIYANAGIPLSYIIDHSAPANSDGDSGAFTLYTNAQAAIDSLPHYSVINEQAFITQDLINALGGNVHIQNSTAATASLAGREMRKFANRIAGAADWPNPYSGGTNITVSSGLFLYTNYFNYPRMAYLTASTATAITNGGIVLAPLTTTFRVLGQQKVSINSVSGGTMYLDSTPAIQ